HELVESEHRQLLVRRSSLLVRRHTNLLHGFAELAHDDICRLAVLERNRNPDLPGDGSPPGRAEPRTPLRGMSRLEVDADPIGASALQTMTTGPGGQSCDRASPLDLPCRVSVILVHLPRDRHRSDAYPASLLSRSREMQVAAGRLGRGIVVVLERLDGAPGALLHVDLAVLPVSGLDLHPVEFTVRVGWALADEHRRLND